MPKTHRRAALVTALFLPACTGLLMWLYPTGCQGARSQEMMRWTCLFPALLVAVPIVMAALLPVALMLNQRFARFFPDGVLAIAIASGVVAQGLSLGAYMAVLNSAYWEDFLGQAHLLPQPFVAGALAGLVYGLTLQSSSIVPH